MVDMLTQVHLEPKGMDRCLRKVREAVWWPGMLKDVIQFYPGCET